MSALLTWAAFGALSAVMIFIVGHARDMLHSPYEEYSYDRRTFYALLLCLIFGPVLFIFCCQRLPEYLEAKE